MRRDTLVFYVLGLAVGLGIAALLHGCYDAHAAEPCKSDFGGWNNGLASPRESGAAGYTPAAEGLPPLPDSSTVEHVTVNHGDAGSNPALAAVQCAGPIVASECYANLEDWLSR